MPGEKFSTTTSAHSMSGSSTSRLSGFFMSSVRLRLEVLRCANQGLSSKLSARDALTCTSRRDRHGRVRDSTLMMSAPRSPRILVVIDPTSAQEKSSTRTPASGPDRVGVDERAEFCGGRRCVVCGTPQAHEPPGHARVAGRRPELACLQVRIREHIRRLRNDGCVDPAPAAFGADVLARPRAEERFDRLFPGRTGSPHRASSGCTGSNPFLAGDWRSPPHPSSR